VPCGGLRLPGTRSPVVLDIDDYSMFAHGDNLTVGCDCSDEQQTRQQ